MKLVVEKLSFSYDEDTPLWKDVSLTVETGGIYSILGANGAGKSTLLRCIIGFQQPWSGKVWIEEQGKRYDSYTDAKKFTQLIGYVPQLQQTPYSFTVRDYVVMGRAPHLGLFQKPGKEDYELTDDILQEMGIYDLKNRPINSLSGGQQRQATIARAIVQEPRIIVMDEPTNHLDYGNQQRVMDIIRKLSAKGIAVLLTTHMPNQAIYLGQQTGILHNGTLASGAAEKIITEEALRNLYQMSVHMVYVPEAGRKICIPGKLMEHD